MIGTQTVQRVASLIHRRRTTAPSAEAADAMGRAIEAHEAITRELARQCAELSRTRRMLAKLHAEIPGTEHQK